MNEDYANFVKKRRQDTIAKHFISMVGVGTIASVFAIIFVILLEI